MAEYSLYYSESEKKEWETQYEKESKVYEEYTLQLPEQPRPPPQGNFPQGSLRTGIVLENSSSVAPHKLTISDARGHVVKTVVSALHDKKNFQDKYKIKTNEVYEGGSVKQGTAVPEHYDIDLVLFSDDLTFDECIRNDGFPDELETIDNYFRETFPKKGNPYKCKSKAKVTLEFDFTLPKLPEEENTVRVKLSLSPHWQPIKPKDKQGETSEGRLEKKELEDFFSELEKCDSQAKRELFIPSTMKLQTDYIKCVNRKEHKGTINDKTCERLHKLIKNVKAWRNKVYKGTGDPEPSSYLITLLMIAAHNRVPAKDREIVSDKQKEPVSDSAYTNRMKYELKNMVWQLGKKESFGTVPFVAQDAELTQIRKDYPNLLPAPWWLLDPVNPANNVYVSGIMSGDEKDTPKRLDMKDILKGWGIFAKKISDIKLSTDVQQMLTDDSQ